MLELAERQPSAAGLCAHLWACQGGRPWTALRSLVISAFALSSFCTAAQTSEHRWGQAAAGASSPGSHLLQGLVLLPQLGDQLCAVQAASLVVLRGVAELLQLLAVRVVLLCLGVSLLVAAIVCCSSLDGCEAPCSGVKGGRGRGPCAGAHLCQEQVEGQAGRAAGSRGACRRGGAGRWTCCAAPGGAWASWRPCGRACLHASAWGREQQGARGRPRAPGPRCTPAAWAPAGPAGRLGRRWPFLRCC